MKIMIIVQARMTSTRLPGKILKQVLSKPLLEYQIERLRRIKPADGIMIATTTNAADDEVIKLCDRLGIEYYRGPEEDVLARYYGAAIQSGADAIVRVTSDCPVIDPEVSGRVIEQFLINHPSYDYVSNTLKRTYPRGLDTEVFSFAGLKDAHENAKLAAEREHVTPYFYTRPDMFNIMCVENDADNSFHRWTVDTKEDFMLIENIISALYPAKPEFTTDDIISLLKKHPNWIEINKHIEQKK